jgi:hypothetical protein
LTFSLVAVALSLLLNRFAGAIQFTIAAALLGVLGYVAFMFAVDVPMYFGRWQTDLANGKEPLGLFAGLYDVTTRWVVTHRIAVWTDEIAWMSLYLSVAVWASLALCGVVLIKDRLPRYRAKPAWPARLRAVRLTDVVQPSGPGGNRLRRVD